MKRKKEQSLILQMGFLYLLVILFFGLIIIEEKKKEVLMPKVDKKLQEYINENYKKENIEKGKIKLNKKESLYTVKVYNKQNKDLYFYVNYNYETKKISKTFEKDYKEGKTLKEKIEKYLNKKLEKLKEKEKAPIKNIYITENLKLTETTNDIKEELLKKNYDLPLYTINIEDNISSLTEEIFTKKLKKINNYIKKINLNPKDYNITLNNKTSPSKSINLKLEKEVLDQNVDYIYSMIIENNKEILSKYNIEYKYLN